MALKYPAHFSEPIRFEIAISQIQHDLRKLFPSVPISVWSKIDQDIADWPNGRKFEITPIHDFWNFFWGFSRGLKLKSLINWITAENISWTKEDVNVDNIWITWDFPGFEFMGKSPYCGADIRKRLNLPQMESVRKRLTEESDFRSDRYAPRDQFPVILIEDNKGRIFKTIKGYFDFEGNRRVIRAILLDQKTIPAFLGKFKNPDDKWPKNYWINTGFLRDLVFLSHGYNLSKDHYAAEKVREFYQIILQDFQIAQINTLFLVFNYIETDDKFLKELLSKELKHETRRNEPSSPKYRFGNRMDRTK